jgi:hypothetical protein
MHILVVGLEGLGTFQSAQDCVAVVAGEDCSMSCWIVTAVDLLLADWKNWTARDP